MTSPDADTGTAAAPDRPAPRPPRRASGVASRLAMTLAVAGGAGIVVLSHGDGVWPVVMRVWNRPPGGWAPIVLLAAGVLLLLGSDVTLPRRPRVAAGVAGLLAVAAAWVGLVGNSELFWLASVTSVPFLAAAVGKLFQLLDPPL